LGSIRSKIPVSCGGINAYFGKRSGPTLGSWHQGSNLVAYFRDTTLAVLTLNRCGHVDLYPSNYRGCLDSSLMGSDQRVSYGLVSELLSLDVDGLLGFGQFRDDDVRATWRRCETDRPE